MPRYRETAQAKVVRDLFVGQPVTDQCEHFHFGPAQFAWL
jgi:hypothetical protein